MYDLVVRRGRKKNLSHKLSKKMREKKSHNLFKFVLVLLYALVERVGVSHMRDFSRHIKLNAHHQWMGKNQINQMPSKTQERLNELWDSWIYFTQENPLFVALEHTRLRLRLRLRRYVFFCTEVIHAQEPGRRRLSTQWNHTRPSTNLHTGASD